MTGFFKHPLNDKQNSRTLLVGPGEGKLKVCKPKLR